MTYRVHVRVLPRQGLLDPQGQAVEHALSALRAVERAGGRAFFVWHRETDLQDADAVILPGGFSYGDYLRCGAIARFSPVMAAVERHAADGGAVLGICNGFQTLCEAGLLPGAMMRNSGLRFICRHVHIRVEQTDTPFTNAARKGQILKAPIAHSDGCYTADESDIAELEKNR